MNASPSQGFQLYRSTDGAGWTKIGDDGFGDAGNFAATLTVENGVLYLTTANYKSGPQVFTSTDGREWNRVFSLEEPSPFNEMGGLVLFDRHVVQAVNDLSNGLSLWREDAEAIAGPGGVTTTAAPTTTLPVDTTTSMALTTTTTAGASGVGAGGDDVEQSTSRGLGSAAIVVLAVVATLAIVGVVILAVVLWRGRRSAPGPAGSDGDGKGAAGGPTIGTDGEGAGGATSDGAIGAVTSPPADIAFCAYCGTSLPPEGEFCPRCGRQVR